MRLIGIAGALDHVEDRCTALQEGERVLGALDLLIRARDKPVVRRIRR